MIEYPSGTPCWVDLGTPDPDRAAIFYSALLGWTVEPADGDGYRLCRLDGRLVAALGPGEDAGRPYWTTNVSVADVGRAVVDIAAVGGSVVGGPTDAGGFGRFAVAVDPGGAPVSLWQPGLHRGAEVQGACGAWVGSRLLTADPIGASAFYGPVFGWTAPPSRPSADQDVFTWTLDGAAVAEAGPPIAGWDAPRRSLWLVSFGVEDVKAAVGRVEQLGGRRVGRLDGPACDLVVVVDDQQAAFALTT